MAAPQPAEAHPVSTAVIADPVQDWPLWWFARLESAAERGDFVTAARAQRELERLGVSVQYRGRRPIRAAEAAHA